MKLTELQGLAYSLKQYLKLLETIQELLKVLATLWEKFSETTIYSRQLQPRMKILLKHHPSSNAYLELNYPTSTKMEYLLGKVYKCFEQGQNSYSGGQTFLYSVTVKNQEGKDIIGSHTQHGPDYNAAVRALKERYN